MSDTADGTAVVRAEYRHAIKLDSALTGSCSISQTGETTLPLAGELDAASAGQAYRYEQDGSSLQLVAPSPRLIKHAQGHRQARRSSFPGLVGAKCLPPRYLAQAGDRPATFLQFEALHKTVRIAGGGIPLSDDAQRGIVGAIRSLSTRIIDPAKKGDGGGSHRKDQEPEDHSRPGRQVLPWAGRARS